MFLFYMQKKGAGKAVLVFSLLAFLLLCPGHTLVWAKDPPPAVYLDGTPLQFDVPPCFQQGVPMFPVRKIFEKLGYRVTFETKTKKVVLAGNGRTVVLYPQNPLYSINEVVYRMGANPFIQQGRLLVGTDFLKECAGVQELSWQEKEGILYLEYGGESGKEPPPLHEGDNPGEYPTGFVEVSLPPAGRVPAGEDFAVTVAAPLVKGIYAYEIRFSYDPGVIEIKDIKNPSCNPEEDFYMKNINNDAGEASYIQTLLGYRDEIPPRSQLAVIEAAALREGAIPFLAGTLNIRLLGNNAADIPAALEEKTLYIGGLPQAPSP